MSADFWAGYLSGAIGIVIGNPLDVVKVRLQAQNRSTTHGGFIQNIRGHFENSGSLVRGAAAPIIGYGALNALLFVAYNRSLMCFAPSVNDPTDPVGVPLYKIWLAGALGGIASWVISSPTELVKCRAQLASHESVSSWSVTKDILKTQGAKGLYFGGAVTSIRDAVGYGFYFWTYELCKRSMTTKDETTQQTALKVLLCGGIAGVATWASVFPLDVIKTRLQAQPLPGSALLYSSAGRQPLLPRLPAQPRMLNSIEISREAYRSEGLGVFYRGLGVCSFRAFIVNAVQWAVYEWIMKELSKPEHAKTNLDHL